MEQRNETGCRITIHYPSEERKEFREKWTKASDYQLLNYFIPDKKFTKYFKIVYGEGHMLAEAFKDLPDRIIDRYIDTKNYSHIFANVCGYAIELDSAMYDIGVREGRLPVNERFEYLCACKEAIVDAIGMEQDPMIGFDI